MECRAQQDVEQDRAPRLPVPPRQRPPAAGRVHIGDPDAAGMLAALLIERMAETVPEGPWDEIAVVCVGTDRSTGDSLGPLTGWHLARVGLNRVAIFGNLDEPVHAANLDSILKSLRNSPKKLYTIAVDACLGKSESVGFVSVNRGALYPGSGVNKVLPPVGHVHVTGIVNVGGCMEYLVLQNTRLSLVLKMADTIARALADAIRCMIPLLLGPVAGPGTEGPSHR